MKFLKEVIDESLKLKDVDEDLLTKEMEKRDYYKDEHGYNYLLNMNIRSFTKQKLEILEKEITELKEKLFSVKNKNPSDMWLTELEELEKKYKNII
jgi:hypothetical protein